MTAEETVQSNNPS